jgi:hypothetical protein
MARSAPDTNRWRAIEMASLPLSRTIPRSAGPGGVAMAAIVSSRSITEAAGILTGGAV